MKTDDQIRNDVRDHYSAIARGSASGCCGGGDTKAATQRLGYSKEEIAAAPEGANLGLGCGNPQAIAELTAGEVVLDLGSGGGFDAFLAAKAVGATGRVIGVDGSSDMVTLARSNASKHGTANVEFRLGEIEHLPLPDASVDVVISNCVVNLAPDKRAVYAEALRVLRPGGRIAISDIVAMAPMPEELADDVAAHCGCVAGAARAGDVVEILRTLGFTEISVTPDPGSAEVIAGWAPGRGFEKLVASAQIRATKPGSGPRKDAGTKAAKSCCGPECCA